MLREESKVQNNVNNAPVFVFLKGKYDTLVYVKAILGENKTKQETGNYTVSKGRGQGGWGAGV